MTLVDTSSGDRDVSLDTFMSIDAGVNTSSGHTVFSESLHVESIITTGIPCFSINTIT